MRLYHVLLSLMVGVLVLSACDTLEESPDSVSLRSTGKLVDKTYEITGFQRVDASHAFDVTVTQGDAFSVALTVDESVNEYLDVRKDGDTLRLTLDDGHSYSIDGRVTLVATITMPTLRGIALSGASTGQISGFESAQSLDVALSGASELDGDIQAGDASFALSGSSKALLSGSAQALTLQVSGASTAELGQFEAQSADVQASGSSHVRVNLDGTLDVQASGSSEVLYTGDVTLGTVETPGSSVVDAG